MHIGLIRDEFEDVSNVDAVYTIVLDDDTVILDKDWKGKHPKTTKAEYEAFVDLIDNPSPQPSDTGSDVEDISNQNATEKLEIDSNER